MLRFPCRWQVLLRAAALGESQTNSTTIRELDIPLETLAWFTPWNISADGRLAGATAYETGNIAVLDLMTGEGRVVSRYGNWDDENRSS